MDPADFYTGIVVDAYAALKSATFAPGPYVAFVEAWGQPALEIGCGDGEPLLDLLASGLDVDGVDSSLDMVRRCRANAAHRGLDVQVFHQRAEDLRLPRRYASIYLAGPTFNLLADDATALRALRAIRAHLTDDGAALVPLWVPSPTPAAELGHGRRHDAVGVTLIYTPLSEVVDRAARTRTTSVRYKRITGQDVEVADRTWVIHWHIPASFRGLCRQAGLDARITDDRTGADAPEQSTGFTATVRRAGH